jgi:hypothetical protein
MDLPSEGSGSMASLLPVLGADDSGELISLTLESLPKDPLDEDKVRSKAEEVQKQMLELSKNQLSEHEFQKSVLQIALYANKFFSKIVTDDRFFKLAYGLVLKSKIFVESIGVELGENLAKFYDLKATIMLNLAICQLRSNNQAKALEFLRDVVHLFTSQQNYAIVF